MARSGRGCLAAFAAYAVGGAMLVALPWRVALANWLVVGAVAALATLTVELSVVAKARAAKATMSPRFGLVVLSVLAWPGTLPRALGYWLTKEPPLTPEAERFLADAAEEYKAKQKRLADDWGFGTAGGNWGFEQTTGVFTRQRGDGTEIRADGQVLGSYQSSDRSWEWAWNNPNVERGVSRDSEQVRELGRRLGIEYLVAGKIPAPTPDAVHYFASIGVKATGADGAFPATTGPLEVVILLKNLRRV